jgi:hypothetical protein
LFCETILNSKNTLLNNVVISGNACYYYRVVVSPIQLHEWLFIVTRLLSGKPSDFGSGVFFCQGVVLSLFLGNYCLVTLSLMVKKKSPLRCCEPEGGFLFTLSGLA